MVFTLSALAIHSMKDSARVKIHENSHVGGALAEDVGNFPHPL